MLGLIKPAKPTLADDSTRVDTQLDIGVACALVRKRSAVQVDYVGAARALVQIVHVLGNDGHGTIGFQMGQCHTFCGSLRKAFRVATSDITVLFHSPSIDAR